MFKFHLKISPEEKEKKRNRKGVPAGVAELDQMISDLSHSVVL